ncbi:MAG TPA: SH3 domain-containing protein [Firmicutes bacterium]|nr:SH3 domain-containing protein [Candidatus Fermentithermobacillaceae bacterium]
MLCLSLLMSLKPSIASADSPASPVPSDFAGFEAIVQGDVCNVRTGPDTSYPWMGQVLQGKRVQILGSQNGWYRINLDSREGYIAGWLVDVDLASRGISARITKTDVNVRQGPSTTYPVKLMVQAGTVLPAEAKRGEWVRVTLGEGGYGWIREDLLVLEYRKPVDIQATDLLVSPSGSSLKVTHSAMVGSETLATLRKGETAKLVGCRGAYIAVLTSQGVGGWVYGPSAVVTSAKDSSLSFGISETSWSIGKYSTVTVTATDVNFRSGPGLTYGVIGMLQKGDVLRFIERQGDWVRAVSPRGVTGWVAAYLTNASANQKATGFSVVADASGSVRSLTVTGNFASAAVLPGSDGKSVIVSTSSFFGVDTRLPINAYEFESIEVKSSDVTVRLLDKPNYRVKQNTPGKVVLEFVPAVTGISVSSGTDAEIVTIDTVGYAWPDVVRNGNTLDLFIPGATYTGGQANGLGDSVKLSGVSARDGGTSVTINTPENAPYVLTRTSNSLTAKFLKPGLAGKVIVIDPGHETDDPGAIGPTGLRERDVNWEIARQLTDLLRKQGAVVIMTRHGLYDATPAPEGWVPGLDEYSGSLARRAAWSKNADLFISIHNDSAVDRNARGTTTYVCDRTLNAKESRRLAGLIQNYLCPVLGTLNRGVRDSDLFVVREAQCPAVLVEVMYISNYTEEAYLRSPNTWELAATGLYRAIERYFNPTGSSLGI